MATRWSGDCETDVTRRCAVIIDAPTDVRVLAHAVFKPPHSVGGGGYGVNVTVNGKGRVTAPGINCGGPKKSLHTCEGLFDTQAAVILTAKPEKHSAFLGWNQFCRANGKNLTLPCGRPGVGERRRALPALTWQPAATDDS